MEQIQIYSKLHEPMRCFVYGTRGSGKSFVVEQLVEQAEVQFTILKGSALLQDAQGMLIFA